MLPPLVESEYLDLAKWRNFLCAPYVEGDGKSSRTNPFSGTLPAAGTWRLDDLRGLHGREISVLIELDPHQLIDSELDQIGRLSPERRADGQRYEKWLRAGDLPPPIEVMETDRGQLKVSDGHRRLVAARNAGANLLCWVSPAVNVPTGELDCNGHPIKTGLTYEIWRSKGMDAFAGSPFIEGFIQEPQTSNLDLNLS